MRVHGLWLGVGADAWSQEGRVPYTIQQSAASYGSLPIFATDRNTPFDKPG